MRTAGSGWGNGKGNDWLLCPECGKKKMLRKAGILPYTSEYYVCHYCKNRFDRNLQNKQPL